MALDKRAVRILSDTFWSPAGWKRTPTTSPDDFAYAKSQGVMFDSVCLTHDQAIDAVQTAVDAIDRALVAEAFVASLSSRRLDLRSGLGSYAAGQHLRSHRKTRSSCATHCGWCGHYDGDVDLNVLSFERIKWGGVRHDHPAYIAFDLQRLRPTPRVTPQRDDIVLLRSILDIAGSLPPGARPNQLDKALSKILPSNSAERRTLISILGFASVLIDPARPTFDSRFVPLAERERTPWHTDDWSYPVQWWTGSNGVNAAAVRHWFDAYLRD